MHLWGKQECIRDLFRHSNFMQTKKIIYSKKAATSCYDLFAVDSVAKKRNFSSRQKIFDSEKKEIERALLRKISASQGITSASQRRGVKVSTKRFRGVFWLDEMRQESQTSSNQKITSTSFLRLFKEKTNNPKKELFFTKTSTVLYYTSTFGGNCYLL